MWILKYSKNETNNTKTKHYALVLNGCIDNVQPDDDIKNTHT